jgi:protease IV
VSNKPLSRLLRRLPNPLRTIGRGWLSLRNRQRLRYKKLDYITFTLPSALPPLPEPRGWLRQRLQGPPPLSLWDFDKMLQRIADDPRPQGIILTLRGVAMSLADLQTLRERGKRVICYSPSYDLASYYIASAADEILMQTGGDVMTLGLRQQALFLKDALGAVGVSLDVVAISPYKGAFDQLSRGSISPEGQAQLEWLLDSRYDILVNDIAAGRNISPDAVRTMIDTAPHLDTNALQAGYVDGVMFEEGLPDHLKARHLVDWKDAKRRLIVKPKPRGADKYVAILRVSGLMIPGESGEPPGGFRLPLPLIGDERAGDITVVRQVRNLMKNKAAAAVVLFIDSGGGAAIAAEAMASALDELAKDRPLVVYMNSIAASGGYLIAAPAQWIVAQPGTITGSIGVVTAKPVTGELREKLMVNAVEFKRGANAGIYSDAAPFTEAQRAIVRASVEHVYRRFVERVMRSRRMTFEAVDAVGGGRVWTGAQAQANGLVDELGDIRAALKKAKVLAKLPDDAPIAVVSGKGKPLPPQLAEAANPAAYLEYALANARLIANGSAQLVMPLKIE